MLRSHFAFGLCSANENVMRAAKCKFQLVCLAWTCGSWRVDESGLEQSAYSKVRVVPEDGWCGYNVRTGIEQTPEMVKAYLQVGSMQTTMMSEIPCLLAKDFPECPHVIGRMQPKVGSRKSAGTPEKEDTGVCELRTCPANRKLQKMFSGSWQVVSLTMLRLIIS